jgi:hypothetical protein
VAGPKIVVPEKAAKLELIGVKDFVLPCDVSRFPSEVVRSNKNLQERTFFASVLIAAIIVAA